MLKSTLITAAAAVAWSPPALAQNMNAEAFYLKAVALQQKGPMALFSGDLKRLMNEGKAAGERARAQRLAAQREGRPARYCPPPGKQSLGSTEFMKRLAAILQADRARIDMTEAMTRILVAKFPCRNS